MKKEFSLRKDARKICEELLRDQRDTRAFKAEVSVVDQLLSRSLELEDAYVELYEKLHDDRLALNKFFDILLDTAASLNLKDNLVMREERD